MLAAKNFQSAMQMLRQIEFALFDFRLHMEYGTPSYSGVQALLDEVRKEVAVITPQATTNSKTVLPYFRRGLRAGYYSYKWAEVLFCGCICRV